MTHKSTLLARAWGQLGDAYSRKRELDQALSAYNKSLDLEKNLSTINNLIKLKKKQVKLAQLKVNSAREGEDRQRYLSEAELYRSDAFKYAQSALSLSVSQTEDSPSSLAALINWGNLSPTGLNSEQLQRGRRILNILPNSRTKVYLGINWAEIDLEQAEHWLSQAVSVAETTGDQTAYSYAVLELALLAEKSGQLSSALKYGQLAIDSAFLKSVNDVMYRAYWLFGRINLHKGDQEAAFKNYYNAIVSFEGLNRGLSKIDVEQRLNFNTQVEPMYRTALELLLEDSIPNDSNLKKSLLIFDKLRLAQLRNFFGDYCLEVDLKNRDSQTNPVRKNAVVFYSIILEDKTHFILELPDGTLHHHQASIGKTGMTELANNWYISITEKGEGLLVNNSLFWQQATELYNIIMRPFEKELEPINSDPIIFVNDGILRNIPMAALFDGKKFLVQKWASFSSIGLNIRATNSYHKSTKALVFGLEESRGTWSTLSSVPQELDNVIDIMGGKKLLNKKFTAQNFNRQIEQNQYSIVHMATHGYFGGVAENSFILAYDKNLTASDINNTLVKSQVPIQLLVFSACETAFGSELSILGLAGVALRSGVNSVLGNYWDVQDDEQPELIKEWYSNLYEKNLGKAKALQKIQLREISKKAHPSKWASFNLIGNWD